MELEITPIVDDITFAARVTGCPDNLGRVMTPAMQQELQAALDRYAVVVVPGQVIDDDDHVALAEHFGVIEFGRPAIGRAEPRVKNAAIRDVSNLDLDGTVRKRDDRGRLQALGNELWHSDSSFRRIASTYSMLHAKVVPARGPRTEFADMRAAWEALDADAQAELPGLVAEHSILYGRRLMGFDFTPAEEADNPPMQHRLVRRHRNTGRPSLFLSAHIGGIVGWERPEALSLIRALTEHATQRQFVYSHQWTVGDLVIWDNRCTMHRVTRYNDLGEPRVMHRITLGDSVSTLDEPPVEVAAR